MFVQISKAGLGMYVSLFVLVLRLLGVGLDEKTAADAILTILNGVGAILWIVGQFARKDLSWGIFRKKLE